MSFIVNVRLDLVYNVFFFLFLNDCDVCVLLLYSLYTFDGNHVNDGKDLESGQFYVAVGRDKFKRLPYSDLLFTKPRGIRRTTG